MALTLSHYRFGIDELAESTHGWHANEDTDPAQGVIGNGNTFLLRFTVQANTTGLTNVDNEFQYRLNGGTWTNITTTSSVVKAVAAAAFANGANCTKRLSGTGTFESSAAGCTEDGTSGGASNDIVASGNSETECGLQLIAADVAHNDTVEFRLTRDGGTLLDTYAVVPKITVNDPVPIDGTLSVTLGAVTSSATGDVAAAGILAATLGAVTLTATATALVEGQTSATLDAVTIVAAGTVENSGISGVLTATLDPITSSATATVAASGSLAGTLGAVTSAGTGTMTVEGQVNATLGSVTLVATGTVPVPEVTYSTVITGHWGRRRR